MQTKKDLLTKIYSIIKNNKYISYNDCPHITKYTKNNLKVLGININKFFENTTGYYKQ